MQYLMLKSRLEQHKGVHKQHATSNVLIVSRSRFSVDRLLRGDLTSQHCM